MQHVMAFVTGTHVCPEVNQHQALSVVSVIVSMASMYTNKVEAKI